MSCYLTNSLMTTLHSTPLQKHHLLSWQEGISQHFQWALSSAKICFGQFGFPCKASASSRHEVRQVWTLFRDCYLGWCNIGLWAKYLLHFASRRPDFSLLIVFKILINRPISYLQHAIQAACLQPKDLKEFWGLTLIQLLGMMLESVPNASCDCKDIKTSWACFATHTDIVGTSANDTCTRLYSAGTGYSTWLGVYRKVSMSYRGDWLTICNTNSSAAICDQRLVKCLSDCGVTHLL